MFFSKFFSFNLTALATPEGSVMKPLTVVIPENKVIGLQSEKQMCHNSRELRCRLRPCPYWNFHHQPGTAWLTSKVSIKASLDFDFSYYKEKLSRKKILFLFLALLLPWISGKLRYSSKYKTCFQSLITCNVIHMEGEPNFPAAGSYFSSCFLS